MDKEVVKEEVKQEVEYNAAVLPIEVVDQILKYLSGNPYNEVSPIINNIQKTAMGTNIVQKPKDESEKTEE